MKKQLIYILVMAVLVSASVFAQKKDIVDTAVGEGTFKTLATALTEAGLVETLRVKVRLPFLPQQMKLLQNCLKEH